MGLDFCFSNSTKQSSKIFENDTIKNDKSKI